MLALGEKLPCREFGKSKPHLQGAMYAFLGVFSSGSCDDDAIGEGNIGSRDSRVVLGRIGRLGEIVKMGCEVGGVEEGV